MTEFLKSNASIIHVVVEAVMILCLCTYTIKTTRSLSTRIHELETRMAYYENVLNNLLHASSQKAATAPKVAFSKVVAPKFKPTLPDVKEETEEELKEDEVELDLDEELELELQTIQENEEDDVLNEM